MTRTLKITHGDWVIDSGGRLAWVEGRAKAAQAMDRLLGLTKPHGAGLTEIIGQVFDPTDVSVALQREIRGAFTRRVAAETSSQIAQRTPEERLAALRSVIVQPIVRNGAQTKTGYAYRVSALTAAGLDLTSSGEE
jgi:hypothetical protein